MELVASPLDASSPQDHMTKEHSVIIVLRAGPWIGVNDLTLVQVLRQQLRLRFALFRDFVLLHFLRALLLDPPI